VKVEKIPNMPSSKRKELNNKAKQNNKEKKNESQRKRGGKGELHEGTRGRRLTIKIKN